ncbi:hypothetical protein CJ030_MR2G013169 [Morella rubra]|uniref:RNase H type-1 domain-containing protein n=1 Tax=Morella rubra TaxID=262757 RepID=A0A6A1W8D8_9ROSI|nr:hypothetical protein CJ030_MR2G013169 [Morella rubra]
MGVDPNRSVWSESPWQLNIVAFRAGSVEDWIQHILHPHQLIGIPSEDQHLFQIFAANSIYMIWAARNRVAHGEKHSDMKEISHRVRLLSWEHKAAWRKKLQPTRVHVWQPPPQHTIKINVDVAIRDDFAAIALDFQGVVLVVGVKQIDAVEPLIDEAHAAKMGTELATHMGFRDIILEGDYELVIKAIRAWPHFS